MFRRFMVADVVDSKLRSDDALLGRENDRWRLHKDRAS
jgi:hypothetical protein